MPISTDEKSGGISVNAHLKTGTINRGMLYYRKEGPVLKLDAGDLLHDSGVKFSFIESSTFGKNINLTQANLVNLQPDVVVELNYSPEVTSRFEMYPPSTNRWLAHVVDYGSESIFTVQSIDGLDKKLLTIMDKESLDLHYMGIVQSYEPSILMMDRDWNVHNEVTYSNIPKAEVFKILEEKSLSLSTLSKLVEGVTLPDLTIGETMEDTLKQLVPYSFSPNVRKQIMAFLGWLDKAGIPREDPIDFILKLLSVNAYSVLAMGHVQCMLDNVEPPHYVQLLHMADRGLLHLTQRPQAEASEQDQWILVKLKLHELFPDWMGRVINYALALQDQGRIVSELPVSKDQAMNSRKAWSDRFAMANHRLFMRGHVQKEILGLVPTIYVGAAHRWPHKHLEWSARLGFSSENPQYIQVMVMPPSAFERVTRILPTVKKVDWEMSSVNLTLYNEKNRDWKLKTSLILKSLNRKRSLRQLTNEFGTWKGANHYNLSQKQAKILDLISWVLYLSSLETERYAKYYGLSNSEIKQELDFMHNQGVFLLHYFLIPEKLKSLCIIANGPPENINSMSRAFLLHTPRLRYSLCNLQVEMSYDPIHIKNDCFDHIGIESQRS